MSDWKWSIHNWSDGKPNRLGVPTRPLDSLPVQFVSWANTATGAILDAVLTFEPLPIPGRYLAIRQDKQAFGAATVYHGGRTKLIVDEFWPEHSVDDPKFARLSLQKPVSPAGEKEATNENA